MTAAELLELAPALAPFALYELRRGVSALVACAASLARIEALLVGTAAGAAGAGRVEAPADLPPELLDVLRAHLSRRPAAAGGLAAAGAAASLSSGA